MSKPTVLVTGGAGFIGSHLVDALAVAGHDVRVLDLIEGQVHGSTGGHRRPDVEYIEASVLDEASVDRALEGVDAVVHLAAQVGVGQSMYEIRRYVEHNCTGTAVLLERMVARQPRPTTLVVASSMSIYGEGRYTCPTCGMDDTEPVREMSALVEHRWVPTCAGCSAEAQAAPTPETKRLACTSVYAVTKRDQEELCLSVGRAYGIRTVALRFFNVYGPRQSLTNPYTGVIAIFASRLLEGQPPLVYEDGLQSRDFVHVSDIVQAIRLALANEDADGVALNVGTGRSTAVLEVARLLRAVLDGEARAPEPEVLGRFREGDIRHCFADISLARKVLGYEPRVSLDDGIAELMSWIRTDVPPVDDRTAMAAAELAERGLVR